jgi:penicillin-binding protein 1A
MSEFAVHAEHFAEMVRQAVYERYQDDAYTKGLRVYTTLLTTHQEAAYQAVRSGALDYDRRHGYRGPEDHADLPAKPTEETLEDALQDTSDSDGLHAAVVVEARPKLVKAYRKGGGWIEIGEEGLKFAARMLGEKASPNQRIRRGAIIRVQKDEKDRWHIAQLPAVEASLVSMDTRDGAVRALVGGFDFNRTQYNHVTQALRQPGSSFKPFIYSAALEKGFTAATVVNDAPLTFTAAQTGSEPWEPKNYDGKFDGPDAAAHGAHEIEEPGVGPRHAGDHPAVCAGLHHPLRLRSQASPAVSHDGARAQGNVTPLQMLGAYGVFANGGYRVVPYYIERVETAAATSWCRRSRAASRTARSAS